MRYDAIIIGTGQAGFPLAGALTDKGWQVALAESSYFGGTCINYGCSPTKTLVASARAAYMARRSADFGVLTGPVSIDFDKVMQRQTTIVERFRSGIVEWLEGIDNLTIYRQEARFEGPHSVRVGDEVIEGERIYINTGARAFVPDIPGLDEVDYLDNVGMLRLKELPEHLLIVGGGYIGLEFGQMFRRFGSEVTIVDAAPRLIGREDADISEAVRGILENEGVRVLTGAKLTQVAQTDRRIHLTLDQDGSEQTLDGTHLLVAIGRRPNSDKLALEKAGVETRERGYINVDDHLQTNVPHIYALGDVNGEGAFTHTSYNDYEIVLDNLDGGDRELADRYMTYALYIDPPLGRVGMNEQQILELGRKALVGTMPMSSVSRAIERDETQGLMKVFVDASTKQILGAAILGINGDEIIHVITGLMYANAPVSVLQNAMHIHPTVSELLPTLVGDLKPLEG